MNLHFGKGLIVVGWLIVILILAGLAALAVWTFKWFPKQSAPKKQDQIDIARKQYAKGEITKEQFERIKKDLNK
jgi:putative membrane protein